MKLSVTPLSNQLDRYYNAGAEIMMMGQKKYCSRHENHFSKDDLISTNKYCKEKGIEFDVFVNRMFGEEEMSDVLAYLQFLKELDVDGIIFSDMGVFQLCRQLQIENKCIYDPGTVLTNSSDAKFLCALGCKRVVVASEITLDEIVKMTEACEHLEVCTFGHLNMSYSKRHLISNYLREIKINEENVDMDHLFLMESTRDEKLPVVQDDYGTSIYMGSILVSFNELSQLTKAETLRLDGYLVDEECYLAAIEATHSVLEGKMDVKEAYDKMKTFSASFTSGYYYRKTNLTKE